MADQPIPLLVICGPTASGKTGWALRLAEHLPLEIISADSRQVYRQMDIGTAKPTADEQARVRHHMIDLIEPEADFSVAEFVDLARPLIVDIQRRGKLPCVVGGTGLYIRALIGGLAPLPTADPELRASLHRQAEREGREAFYRRLQRIDPVAAAGIHPNNLVRVVRALEVYQLSGKRISDFQAEHQFSEQSYRTLQLAWDHPRELLYWRIEQRSEQMLADGLIDEVSALVQRYGPELKALQTLGYREALNYLEGSCDRQRMLNDIQLQTRRYAKRQLTWFRKQPEIIWVDSSWESGRVLRSIEDIILR